MSRSGKTPIKVPQGLEVKIENQRVFLKGPRGSKEVSVPEEIKVELKDSELLVMGPDTPDGRRVHGLYRALINGAVQGVTEGYEKRLEMVGVGYRASVKGNILQLNLGFSHPTEETIPEGIEVKVEDNVKIVS